MNPQHAHPREHHIKVRVKRTAYPFHHPKLHKHSRTFKGLIHIRKRHILIP